MSFTFYRRRAGFRAPLRGPRMTGATWTDFFKYELSLFKNVIEEPIFCRKIERYTGPSPSRASPATPLPASGARLKAIHFGYFATPFSANGRGQKKGLSPCQAAQNPADQRAAER
jgi:hypothetical protein